MKRPALTASVLLTLVFVLGGLAGMALEEGLGLDWFDFLDEDERPAEARLLAGLDLTPDQEGRIEVILERQEDRLEDYWESRIPDMRAIVSDSYEEVRGILTPAQRSTFDRRIEEGGIQLRRGDD